MPQDPNRSTAGTRAPKRRRPPVPGSEYLNESQVEARFAIPRATLRTWRCRSRSGGPPFVKLGARVLYKLSDLVAWLDARRVDPERKRGKRKAGAA